MELMAAIGALEALTAPRADLFTDSAYVRDGITSWIHGWKRTAGDRREEPVKNDELWRRLDAAARHRVTWDWVKGHAGHPETSAPTLARDGMAPFKPPRPARPDGACRSQDRDGAAFPSCTISPRQVDSPPLAGPAHRGIQPWGAFQTRFAHRIFLRYP